MNSSSRPSETSNALIKTRGCDALSIITSSTCHPSYYPARVVSSQVGEPGAAWLDRNRVRDGLCGPVTGLVGGGDSEALGPSFIGCGVKSGVSKARGITGRGHERDLPAGAPVGAGRAGGRRCGCT